MSPRKRYAQVGIGGRSMMYSRAICETYADTCEIVGLCDNNEGRLRDRQAWFRERGAEVPIYLDGDFDRMVSEQRPDVVIVTTRDGLHHKYVVRAMELGCDAVTEKPMTTDEHKCQAIINTQRKTGRRCTVTFNYRYSPPRTQIKDLLMSGVIGDVLSVDFQWLLDTRHGASYFRRWNRYMEDSGGLLVHKATHHFDLVNWWLSSVPVSVFALGEMKFYTPHQARRYGVTEPAEHCLDCPESGKCPFYVDFRGNEKSQTYLENRKYDGYLPNLCVFSDRIDIYDSMQVIAKYATGATMSYTLNAFTPWEGYFVAFNGSRGRIEHASIGRPHIPSSGAKPGWGRKETITIFPHFKESYPVEVWEGTGGGHGGGDVRLLDNIFLDSEAEDKYMRAADQRAGAWSILTGVAANRSIERGQPVRIDELVQGIGVPDYPEMPSR